MTVDWFIMMSSTCQARSGRLQVCCNEGRVANNRGSSQIVDTQHTALLPHNYFTPALDIKISIQIDKIKVSISVFKINIQTIYVG